jgi:hypothetical protein
MVNEIDHQGRRGVKVTLVGVPDLNVTVATAGYEFIRGAVVVHAEHIAGMTFQNFCGQSLSNSSNGRSKVRVGRNGRRTVSTVHIRIVVSSDAEARKTLSNDQAISDRPFECPVKFLTS